MNRKIFDQTLKEAISCAVVFVLVVVIMTELPSGGFIWGALKLGLLIFLVLLNGVMLIGFTSLENDNTKAFYAYVIPIYPLYLISEELIWRWEWWHYVVILISYGVCFSILASCFANRTFTRSVESIVIVLSIFSTPYLYSAIF